MAGRASYDYSGESAIVTGSTKGIGRGIAEGLAEADANVVINARTPADVKAVADELDEYGDGDVIGVTADMSALDEIERLVDTAVEAFGEIDLLVNNAAVWPEEESLVDAPIEDWEFAMDVNV